MSVAPGDDAPHLPVGRAPSFLDGLTFSFGDPRAELYGVTRVGLGGDGSASAMAILYSRGQAVAVAGEAGVPVVADVSDWDSVRAAGVSSTVEQPLKTWTVTYEGADGNGFALRFEAISSPAVIEPESPAGQAGGLQGYEQSCSVSGTVSRRGSSRKVRCLGQRGHLWGAPDLGSIEVARTLSAWLGADRSLSLTAVQPARAKLRHLDEAIAGWVVERGEPIRIAEPRLSTTYDGDLRQQRAGLELWMDEDGAVGRRAWGELLCATTIELADMRLDSAFFAWRMEGREGIGLYDVLRRKRDERAGR